MNNEDEYGSCPNCGASVHTSEMGNEGGVVCCQYCFQEVRKYQSMDPMMNARRIKVLILDPLEVGRFFTNTTTFKVESKLPLDAKCVSVDKDVRNNRLLFWYESKEFDLVEEGDVMQELPWDTFMIYDEGN